MPRLRKTPEQRADAEFRAALAAGLARNEINREQLASMLGVARKTLYNTDRNPEVITLKLLRKLALLGLMTPDELTKIVFCGRN